MTTEQALVTAKKEVSSRGFRVSAGSWADDETGTVYAFSIESCGPATYGACKLAVQGRRYNGIWAFAINNREIQLA